MEIGAYMKELEKHKEWWALIGRELRNQIHNFYSNLNPCSNCGGDATLDVAAREVFCMKCSDKVAGNTLEEAILKWNGD